MAKLDILIPETTKDQETQNKQVFLCFQNLLNWSNNILTNIAVDYKEATNAGDISTTSTSYVGLDNYSQSATVKNPTCLVNLNMMLKGTGYLGLFINGFLTTEVPFNNMSFNPIIHSYYYNLKVGKNTIEWKWRAINGTATKANSTANPGFNAFQIISFNS